MRLLLSASPLSLVRWREWLLIVHIVQVDSQLSRQRYFRQLTYRYFGNKHTQLQEARYSTDLRQRRRLHSILDTTLVSSAPSTATLSLPYRRVILHFGGHEGDPTYSVHEALIKSAARSATMYVGTCVWAAGTNGFTAENVRKTRKVSELFPSSIISQAHEY